MPTDRPGSTAVDTICERIPGLYAHIKAGAQRHHDEPDPRLMPADYPYTPKQQAEVDQLRAECKWAPPGPFLARMHAGQPVNIPAWMACTPSNSIKHRPVEWIHDLARQAGRVWLSADDTVRPAAPSDPVHSPFPLQQPAQRSQ